VIGVGHRLKAKIKPSPQKELTLGDSARIKMNVGLEASKPMTEDEAGALVGLVCAVAGVLAFVLMLAGFDALALLLRHVLVRI
jgi:hypothetical protein